MLPSQHLVLNSAQATELSSRGNQAVFELAYPIAVPSNVEALLTLKSVSYSNVFKNVVEAQNDTLHTSRGSIVVPGGAHSVYTVLDALNAAGLGLTWTYDPITFRVSVAASTGTVQVIDGEASLARTLGFRVPTADGSTVAGAYAVSLQGVQTVQVSLLSPSLGGAGVKGGVANLLAAVPNNALSGSVVTYVPSAYAYRLSANTLTRLELGLYDQDGLPLDFNGSAWHVALFLSFRYADEYRPAKSLLSAPTPVDEPPPAAEPAQPEQPADPGP